VDKGWEGTEWQGKIREGKRRNTNRPIAPQVAAAVANCELHKPSFLVYLVFNHDFIINIDFTSIAASNTASDDVTYRSHRILNTNF